VNREQLVQVEELEKEERRKAEAKRPLGGE
jgi:hypothetical protein